jgi:glycosyltransferase involved in cell wall biosynthesis
LAAPPRVSLLMPVHNRGHLLDLVLRRLAENTTYENVELVAVDDRSTDESPAILRRFAEAGTFPEVRILANNGEGAIAALNTALNAATGEYCVQLDDDITVETPGWIERMVEFMQIDDAVGLVTGRIIFDTGDIHGTGVHVIGESGWHERTTWPSEPIGERLWLNRIDGRRREGEAGEAETRAAEVDSGIGALMMYRRDDALAAGGYDMEWSPVWFDDVDLSLGIRLLGKKNFYIPDVRAIHYFKYRWAKPTLRDRIGPTRIRRALMRRIGSRLPLRLRRYIERRYPIDLMGYYTKDQCARLHHHHAYWREKWGWDACNPDLGEIERRWGDTELWWAYDPARRAEGERIAEAYDAIREARAARAV